MIVSAGGNSMLQLANRDSGIQASGTLEELLHLITLASYEDWGELFFQGELERLAYF